MRRCAYCKKKAATGKTAARIWTAGSLKTQEWDYCSPQCKTKIHEFVGLYNRFAPRFPGLWALGVLIIANIPWILQLITKNNFYMEVWVPVALALLGVVLIVYPLGIVTRNYYERLGIRNTTWFIRITGLLMIITGYLLVVPR